MGRNINMSLRLEGVGRLETQPFKKIREGEG